MVLNPGGVIAGEGAQRLHPFYPSTNFDGDSMAKIFVGEVQHGTGKTSGKPYVFQRVQLVQGPKRADAFDMHFPGSEAEAAPVGMCECDIYVRSTATGNKPAYENFRKAD
jgi:hypothetical protein